MSRKAQKPVEPPPPQQPLSEYERGATDVLLVIQRVLKEEYAAAERAGRAARDAIGDVRIGSAIDVHFNAVTHCVSGLRVSLDDAILKHLMVKRRGE